MKGFDQKYAIIQRSTDNVEFESVAFALYAIRKTELEDRLQFPSVLLNLLANSLSSTAFSFTVFVHCYHCHH